MKGVQTVTYPDVESMGDCKIYHWLDLPNQDKIDEYALKHNGEPYDWAIYFWVIVTNIFGIHINIINKKKMCWENTSEFDRFMGHEIQPQCDPPLISTMINALEKKK
jgi:hypothetical protein